MDDRTKAGLLMFVLFLIAVRLLTNDGSIWSRFPYD